jgi:hypothetical protein
LALSLSTDALLGDLSGVVFLELLFELLLDVCADFTFEFLLLSTSRLSGVLERVLTLEDFFGYKIFY